MLVPTTEQQDSIWFCRKQCFLPPQHWLPSSAIPFSTTGNGFPALFSHLEYPAPNSSTIALSSTGTPSPILEGGGALNPHHCSGLWCLLFTPARWNGLESGCGAPSECELSLFLCSGSNIIRWEPLHLVTWHHPSCGLYGSPHVTSPQGRSSDRLRATWNPFPCLRALNRALNQLSGATHYDLRSIFPWKRTPRRWLFVWSTPTNLISTRSLFAPPENVIPLPQEWSFRMSPTRAHSDQCCLWWCRLWCSLQVTSGEREISSPIQELSIDHPPGIIQRYLRSFFRHSETKNGILPHYSRPQATSILQKQYISLRGT